MFFYYGWITSSHTIIRNVTNDHTSGSDYATTTNRHTWANDYSTT